MSIAMRGFRVGHLGNTGVRCHCDARHGPCQGLLPSSECGGVQAWLSRSFLYEESYIPLELMPIGGSEVRVGVRFATLALAGAACSGIGDYFKEPDIQLDHAVVRGVSLTGGTLDLVVKVDNPNKFTLQGTKLQVGIDVEGSHLGDLTYDSDFAVSQDGMTTLTLPLRFGWSGVGGAVRAALGYGDLPYKMNGQATLKLPGGGRTVVPSPTRAVLH